jgi:hypothetical protein
MRLPRPFAGICPVLAEKLKENERLDASELDCEHLNRLAIQVYDQQLRRINP